MADTKTPVIQIKTLEAVKSVQDLKNNIKELKKQLDTLEIGTDKYKSTLKDLKTNQNALKNAMYGTSASFKDIAQSATGANVAFDNNNKLIKAETLSYNELVSKMAELKMQWRTLTDETERANVGAQIESVNDRLKELDASIGNYSRNVGNYRNSLEGLSVTMSGLKQVGNSLNSGFRSAVSVLNSVGFAINEDNRAMKAWNASLALANGADGILKWISNLRKQTDAEKGLTTAKNLDTVSTTQNTVVTRENTVAKEINDKATKKLTISVSTLKAVLGGVALLIGGFLLANLDKVADWAEKAAAGLGKMLSRMGLINIEASTGSVDLAGYKREMKLLNDEMERQVALMGASGLSNTNIIEFKIKEYNKALDKTNEKLKSAYKTIGQMHLTTAQAANTLYGWLYRSIKGINKAFKDGVGAVDAIEADAQEIKDNISLEEFNLQLEQIRVATEKQREAANKALEEARKKAEELATAITNAIEKSKDAINETLSPAEQIKAKYQEQLDLLNKGLKALDEQAKSGKNLDEIAKQRKTIEDGILATLKLQTKELNEQTAKEFEEAIKNKKNYIERTQSDVFASLERIRGLYKDVFGYTDAQIDKIFQKYKNNAEKQQDINHTLQESVKELSEGYKGLDEAMSKAGLNMDGSLEDKLKEAFRFSLSNPKEFAEIFSEPLATAIKTGIELFDEDEQIKQDMLNAYVAKFDAAFTGAINNKDLGLAKGFAMQLSINFKKVYEEIFGEPLPKELEGALSNKLMDYASQEFELLLNGNMNIPNILNLGKAIIDDMFPEGTDDYVKKRVEAWIKIINSATQAYGNATSNMLGNLGDMWNNYLKLRYKNQVESGKKTEKEAKAQAERAFENVKALQYATAAVSTAAAVVQALADPTVPSYYVKAANAAAALAAGIAQAMQIRMSEFGAPSLKEGSSTSAPQLVDRTPQLQYVVGINEADYAQAQAANPIRAYVVDRDLSEGLDEYNKRKDETTF